MTSGEVLIGIVVLALAAPAAVTLYRWRRRQRVRRVEGWVRDYLVARFRGLPDRLSIHCSDDPRGPVLVGFDNVRTGSRHSLRFACPGAAATLSLLSEEETQGNAGEGNNALAIPARAH